MPIRQYRSSIPRSQGILLLASSNTASSVSSGTAEVQLASVVIPAGIMGTNGILRIRTLWVYTSSGNTKTLRVRFGGSGGTIYGTATPTTTISSSGMTTIANNNSVSAQKGAPSNMNLTVPFGAVNNALITSAIDTTAATTVYISGQPASGGETITLESYTVELIPGV